MPSLDFKGKQFVYTHHLTVPFRELVVDAKKSLPLAKGKPSMDDNLIIHGDNLHALKALLPRYAGKVKCIYVDPPYNTGNEGWCYNDNVRSPLLQEWVKHGNPVEREDMERHDKWLSMMWPRLSLLKELLSERGIIFVSIDENEHHRLKCSMDDLFSENNFVGEFVWKNKHGGGGDSPHLAKEHEHILVYAKSLDALEELFVSPPPEYEKTFRLEDNRGKYYLDRLDKKGIAMDRPNLIYDIICPDGSVRNTSPIPWRLSQAEFKKRKSQGEIVFKQDKGGEWQVYTKTYLMDLHGNSRLVKARSVLRQDRVGFTQDGNKEIEQILGKRSFNNPKPSRLIKYLLDFATHNEKDALILDSFAGSGTTAHATLALNKEDGGNRKFILIECEDYANKITAERVRRVIKGVRSANDDALKQGLGGSFTYCELGQEINVETLLKSGKLPDFDTLARDVFYTATGQTLQKVPKPGKDFFVGETDAYRVHLVYKPDREFLRSGASALNSELVERIAAGNKTKKRALVFATAKYMGQRELSEQRIEFAQLPYAIYRVIGD
jgi:adenine-specific DNA-methyltransferase